MQGGRGRVGLDSAEAAGDGHSVFGPLESYACKFGCSFKIILVSTMFHLSVVLYK